MCLGEEVKPFIAFISGNNSGGLNLIQIVGLSVYLSFIKSFLVKHFDNINFITLTL